MKSHTAKIISIVALLTIVSVGNCQEEAYGHPLVRFDEIED